MTKKTKLIIALSILATIIVVCSILLILSKNKNNDLAMLYFFENKVATSLVETKSMDPTKPIITMFHAQYCKTCHQFKPAFDRLSKDLAKDYNFLYLDIQDPANYPLVAANVDGLPSLYIFDPLIGNKINISVRTAVSYEMLKSEFERYTRIRSFIDLEKAKIHHDKLMEEHALKLQASKNN